ncbi:hypothetical protein BX666DRAFT_961032 [Dichotomocladium elegans]|nr:hypothetical protein BX666DRAFT_961032 [Dichotomocladium elegans]
MSMAGLGLSLPRIHTPFSFEEIAIRNEPSQCTISEIHHQNHPSEHIHLVEEERRACLKANNIEVKDKERILHSLQSMNKMDIDWALNCIVTISFECPEQLLLDGTPRLLDLLVERGSPFFGDYDRSATITVLHILRNFSFLRTNAQVLAGSKGLLTMLQKCLALAAVDDAELKRHCIDVLENIAPYVELSGPFDELIPCLTSVLYSQERHLLIGTILVLTMLTLNESNRLYLLSGAITTIARVSHLLVINDEELIGVVIEYLYQYSKVSADFRRQLLLIHSGADIGILVSLLTAKSKYFTPKLVLECDEGSQDSQSPASNGQASFEAAGESHGSVPCVPSLSAYQELDEPYRCLGWLKDKFEVTDRNSVLSLDDMYLLYEMRFGQERALKMKDFYTVLKISFPEASATDGSQEGLVLEGTLVRGIQIKMSILKDGAEMMCQWTDCSKVFEDEMHLQRHILQDHVGEYQQVDGMECMWTDCADTLQEFKDKDEMVTHLGTHFDAGIDLTPPLPHHVVDIDHSEPKGVALVAAYLLRQLSKDRESHRYFIPYENELLAIARRRPKMAPHIQYMFSHFCIH